jgi:arsenate reductase
MLMRPVKVLFLCTGNSCRSQMAEGWARHLKSEVIEAFSAGIEAHGVNPLTVEVMAEAGVDISGQRSKCVDDLGEDRFDHVVTLCGHANEHCPVFAGKTHVVHVGFEDPAVARGSRGEVLACFRHVRDRIRAFVQTLPEALDGEQPPAGGPI